MLQFSTLKSLLALTIFLSLQTFALSQNLNDELTVGDIIRYEKFRESRHGLVTEVNRAGAWVEHLNDKGQFQKDLVSSMMTKWKFVIRSGFDPNSEEEFRDWISANGKFKIIAKMQTVDDTNVQLLKKDGTTVTVEIEKLSESDQKFISESSNKTDDSENPFGEGALPALPDEVLALIARRDEVLAQNARDRQTANSAANAKTIDLKHGPISLKSSTPTPASNNNRARYQIDIPALMDHARIESMAISKNPTRLALMLNGSFKDPSVLALINPQQNKVLTATVESRSSTLAISPSAKTVAVFTKSHLKNRLEIWADNNGNLERIGSMAMRSFIQPEVILFDDASGVIMDHRGQLGFFDIDKGIVPTHTVESNSHVRKDKIRLSNSGDILLYFQHASHSIYAIDIDAKECVGGVEMDLPVSRSTNKNGTTSLTKISYPSFSFDTDGKHILCGLNNEVFVFSIQTGRQVGKHDLPDNILRHNIRSLRRLTPEILLVNSSDIYDVGLGQFIGSVSSNFGIGKSAPNDDGSKTFCTISRSGSQNVFGGVSRKGTQATITFAKLPIERIVAFRQSLSEEDIVKLTDGDTIQLTMELGKSKRYKNQIQEKVKQDIARGGIALSDQSDFHLILTYAAEKPKTEEYRISDMGTGRQTVTTTSKSCLAVLKYKGEKIWSRKLATQQVRAKNKAHLDQIKKEQKGFSPKEFLKIEYPSTLSLLLPSKKATFQWQ